MVQDAPGCLFLNKAIQSSLQEAVYSTTSQEKLKAAVGILLNKHGIWPTTTVSRYQKWLAVEGLQHS